VLAVIAFVVLVRDPAHSPNPTLRFVDSLWGLPSQFKRYLTAVGVFGCGDFSHSLLILAATHLLAPNYGLVQGAQIAGLLYVGRNTVQVLASYPAGAVADRVGPLRVLTVGYALGAATSLLMAMAFYFEIGSPAALAGIFVLAGLYSAIQEALETTVTAGLVDRQTLATSLGALGTVNGTAKLLSSTAVGVLWSAVSPVVGFSLAACLMTLGTAVLRQLHAQHGARAKDTRGGRV
jgi:MFS family permease